MKFLFAFIFLIGSEIALGQDVNAKLDDASSAYKSNDLENTRFALQQSLAELDVLVGQEILSRLPDQLAGNSFDAQNDQVSGNAAGLRGVFVQRSYPGETKSVEIELVTDSPLLSALSGYLTNPLFASVAGGNQKVIKIDSYKAMLQKDENDPLHYEVQVPIDQSLFIIRYDGFDSENEVTGIAKQVGIGRIAPLLK